MTEAEAAAWSSPAPAPAPAPAPMCLQLCLICQCVNVLLLPSRREIVDRSRCVRGARRSHIQPKRLISPLCPKRTCVSAKCDIIVPHCLLPINGRGEEVKGYDVIFCRYASSLRTQRSMRVQSPWPGQQLDSCSIQSSQTEGMT